MELGQFLISLSHIKRNTRVSGWVLHSLVDNYSFKMVAKQYSLSQSGLSALKKVMHCTK